MVRSSRIDANATANSARPVTMADCGRISDLAMSRMATNDDGRGSDRPSLRQTRRVPEGIGSAAATISSAAPKVQVSSTQVPWV